MILKRSSNFSGHLRAIRECWRRKRIAGKIGINITDMPKKIVSSGYNTALLRVRNADMEMAGYVVVTSKESSVIVDLLEKQAFDGAVICSSIPLDLRVELARTIKRAQPDLPLIVLYTDGET